MNINDNNNATNALNNSDASIYAIVSISTGLKYIGSTRQTISLRMSGHRSKYKKYMNNSSGHYTTSFIVLEQPDAKIELVEALKNCDSRYLQNMEAWYIRNNVCVNKQVPTNIIADNKQGYRLQYYAANKAVINARSNSDYAGKGKLRVSCDICNTTMCARHLPHHKKTKKHKNNMIACV